MTLAARPAAPRGDTTDAKRRLVEAIAGELWTLCGKAGALDWPEVDRHLDRIVEQARSQTHQTRVELAPSLDIPQAAGNASLTSGTRHGRKGDERVPRWPTINLPAQRSDPRD